MWAVNYRALTATGGAPMRRLLKRARWKAAQGRQAPREAQHDYWRAPPDSSNQPTHYANVDPSRAAHLRELLTIADVPLSASILEVGCNVGRNLADLANHGWANLAGIDISQDALDEARIQFPELADVPLTCAPLEDALPQLGDGSIDVVFAMAVLEHIHYDSNVVLDEIARVAAFAVVTIENEQEASVRHFPRNYRTVFEQRGLRQVHEEPSGADLPDTFVS